MIFDFNFDGILGIQGFVNTPSSFVHNIMIESGNHHIMVNSNGHILLFS